MAKEERRGTCTQVYACVYYPGLPAEGHMGMLPWCSAKMKQEPEVTANHRASRQPQNHLQAPPPPFCSILCSFQPLHKGNFQSKERRRRRGQETVGSPILHAGRPRFGSRVCLTGEAPSPAVCSTRAFCCEGVRCHLATAELLHRQPKKLRKDAPNTVSQPQRWGEAATLPLAMTRGFAAIIPPSAARCSAGGLGRASLVNWKSLKGGGKMLI